MNQRVAATYLLVLMYCLFFIGCAPPSIHVQVEGLAPEEISTIKIENKYIFIVEVDGEDPVESMAFLLHGQWVEAAYLKPGEHEMIIMYYGEHMIYSYLYKLVTRAGNSYMIKDKIVDGNVVLWFEDLNTRQSVGKMLRSMNFVR